MISLHRDMHSVNVNVVEGKNPTREVFTPDFEAWRQQLTFFGIDLNHLESNPGCMSSLSWTTTMEGILVNSSLRYSLQSVINMAHFLLHDEEPQPQALIYWHEFIFENFSLNSKPANFSIFSVVSERKREETGHALYKGFPSKFTGITAIKVWPVLRCPQQSNSMFAIVLQGEEITSIDFIDFWAHNVCVKFCHSLAFSCVTMLLF